MKKRKLMALLKISRAERVVFQALLEASRAERYKLAQELANLKRSTAHHVEYIEDSVSKTYHRDCLREAKLAVLDEVSDAVREYCKVEVDFNERVDGKLYMEEL